MVSFRDEESQPDPSRVHDSQRWRQVRWDEHGMEGSEGSQGTLSGLTGVIREYRGRGIAVALKLKVIEFARNNKYEKLRTWNDSTNAPMIGINIKLGFKREVGWITLEKNLA